MTHGAATPIASDANASAPIPTLARTVSVPWPTDGSRGIPRNVIPVARTNASAASPAVRASSAPASAIARCDPVPLTRKPCISPSSPSHSDTKPLNGGRAASAAPPARVAIAAAGRRRWSPPRRSMSLVPVACSTVATEANRPALAKLWAVI